MNQRRFLFRCDAKGLSPTFLLRMFAGSQSVTVERGLGGQKLEVPPLMRQETDFTLYRLKYWPYTRATFTQSDTFLHTNVQIGTQLEVECLAQGHIDTRMRNQSQKLQTARRLKFSGCSKSSYALRMMWERLSFAGAGKPISGESLRPSLKTAWPSIGWITLNVQPELLCSGLAQNVLVYCNCLLKAQTKKLNWHLKADVDDSSQMLATQSDWAWFIWLRIA